MRWPWRRETRSARGGYSDAVVQAIEAQASAKVADVSGTAATEAAAGALSRALCSAEVQGPGWVRDAVSPVWLAQVGRSLVREGASLSVIGMRGGNVTLVPTAFYNFEKGSENDEHEEDWFCRATTYGPGSSTTRLLTRGRLIFVRWGTSPGTRYRGQGPTSWASLTARLLGEAERSLADEACGPLAQIVPHSPGRRRRRGPGRSACHAQGGHRQGAGQALLVETVAGGWSEGRAAAPQRDWVPSRLGPMPPDGMVNVADASYQRMLAGCGCSAAMFDGSDGTSKREALRQWFMGTVQPLARLLEHELTLRLEAEVRLKFDG